MKKLIYILLLLCFFQGSYAAEKCTVQAYAAIFLKSGRIEKNIKLADGLFVIRAKNWNACYNYAVKLANKSPGTMDLIVTSWRVKGGRQETTAHVYFDWSYNDGIFWDTKGKITKQTDNYEPLPDIGDLRYFPDGSFFE